MKRRVVTSEDGSRTLTLTDAEESYHSMFGALTESRHIYLAAGLEYLVSTQGGDKSARILEIGFGTGLNCLLTALYAYENPPVNIHYTTIEKYPVTPEEIELLDHPSLFEKTRHKAKILSAAIHGAAWEKESAVLKNMTLLKIEDDICDALPKLVDRRFNLVYFDAFAPDLQPELWSLQNFKTIFNSMECGGVLVTYSSKGTVKSTLREAGFEVSRLRGPKGKRHMVRAVKPELL